jgi:hypothetical protein
MRVLTTRGGELAAPFGPLCSDPECGCSHDLAALESAYPADTITVAERDGFTLDDLIAACAAFLQRTGWTDDDGEIAHMMAEEAADVADHCEVGTRLLPRFNHETEQWDWHIDDGPAAPLTEVLT